MWTVAEVVPAEQHLCRVLEQVSGLAAGQPKALVWDGKTYWPVSKGRARSEDDLEGRASAIAGLQLGLSVVLRLSPIRPDDHGRSVVWVFAEETDVESAHLAQWLRLSDSAETATPSPDSIGILMKSGSVEGSSQRQQPRICPLAA